MRLTSLLLNSGLVSLALASYALRDDYSGNNFFSKFTFDTEDDPTHGYVNYMDKTSAQNAGLWNVQNGVVFMKVDNTNTASGRGRNSLRVTSTVQYTHGLVVLDLGHMPGNSCGIWPAFWMFGPNWPNSGEIDIIEGVNFNNQNTMTMHTSSGCTLVNQNCLGNQGCGVQAGGSNSYGNGFNNNGGGVYAMEWTSGAIKIWFWPQSATPGDASGPNPNPAGWGNPTALFQGGSNCNIDSHFASQNIVFDTTFCGDWAGQSSVYNSNPQCTGSCTAYVQNNPHAYDNAYWSINSLKVYTQNGAMAMAEVQESRNITSTAYGPFKLPGETKTWQGHGENQPTATVKPRRKARHVVEHVAAAADHA